MTSPEGPEEAREMTVPFEDYKTFLDALMTIKYRSVSLADAQVVALNALRRNPAALVGAPKRDAEHCDYPDCEQHNALVVAQLHERVAELEGKLALLKPSEIPCGP